MKRINPEAAACNAFAIFSACIALMIALTSGL
jgi:hypothetical protein